MKALAILLLIALVAGLLVTPILTDMETRRNTAAAERTYAEARLEQARAGTITARSDAFARQAIVLLPWGLMIGAGAFVAVMLVLVAGQSMRQSAPPSESSPSYRPTGIRLDSIAGPVYMIQAPGESREQFMLRVSTTERLLEHHR